MGYVKKRTPECIEALLTSIRNGASVVSACEAAAISRGSFYAWCKEDLKLKDQVEESKSSRVTFVEDALYKQALKGNIAAIIFFLKNKAGWKDSFEGKGFGDTKVIIIKERNGNEGRSTDISGAIPIQIPQQ